MYYNFASRYLVRYQPLVTLLKPQLAPQLFVMFHHLLKILVVLSRILPLTMSLLTISKQIAGNFRGGGGGGQCSLCSQFVDLIFVVATCTVGKGHFIRR